VLLIGLKIIKIGGKVFICNNPPLPPLYKWTNLLKGIYHQAVSVLEVKIINKEKNREKNQCIREEK